jgi:molybdenum cofactor sulfurtransferase
VSYDNHNSVNGIREFARRGGAEVVYVPVRPGDLRLDEALVRRALREHTECQHRLFAYPAQSNFSGVQHPLEWIDEARSLGWDVLLDSAAFAPTNRLDLSSVNPDFVPALVLQDVRLSDRHRRAHRTPRSARQDATSVVRGRHDHARERAG